MKHQTQLVESEITLAEDDGAGCTTYQRAKADRVLCTCGYVSAPFLIRAEAHAEASAHKAAEYANGRSTGE